MGVILLFIEYRTGLFHPTDSKRDHSILGRIIKTLKPKPRLVITVRDINCYVAKRMVQKHDMRRIQTVMDRTWWVELTARIENKGKAPANNVTWQAELILGEGNSTVSFTKVERRKSFSLAKRGRHPLVIGFQRVEVPQEVSELYPNSPYRLEYTYSCDEHSRSQKAMYSGRLGKADWICDPHIGDADSLRVIKNVGFHE